MQQIRTLAKITVPRTGTVCLRKRLFERLDKAFERSLAWVSAPAGFGKTTLVSSYLNDRRRPCLWYRMDAGDADMASFFYHLSLAAKHAAPERCTALPPLTPEYKPGLSTFVRNFFRGLFACLTEPTTLVFDDYHEVPPDAEFHRFFAEAMEEIPKGWTVLVSSRVEPPTSFSRLRANRALDSFETPDLAFSPAETEELVRALGYDALAPGSVEALHRRFNGWCAGMVLQLRYGAVSDIRHDAEPQQTPESVFDYLANEVFGRMLDSEQGILLRCALLPQMSEATLTAMTGSTDACRLLEDLNRQGYFTTRSSETPPVYQFHALFREFLLKAAGYTFSPEERRSLQQQAGSLLLADGEISQAAVLFEAAGAFDQLLELILTHAPELAAQGRLQQLHGLIEKLPSDTREHPWIVYWFATTLLPVDLQASRGQFERALEQFETAGVRDGMFLSWAGVVDSLIISWDDLRPLGRWIAWMDRALAEDEPFPNPMVETRVVFGMFSSLIYHRPDHPDMPFWIKRVEALLERLPDDNLRIGMATHYLLYLGWKGDFRKAGVLVERLRSVAAGRTVQPVNRIAWYQAEALYHWLIADFETSDAAVTAGLELATSSGIRLFDFILLIQRFYTRLDAGSPVEREKQLGDVMAIMDRSGAARQSHYYYVAALDAQLRRDPANALLYLEKALTGLHEAGLPFPYALNHIAKARVLTELGRFDEAVTCLDRADEFVTRMDSAILRFSLELARAELAMARDDDTGALPALAAALAHGRSRGYLHFDWWRPYAMRELCVKALDHGVEVDYVRELIRRRRLDVENPPVHLENWPWRIRICTLGGFAISMDGASIRSGARGSQKPLELLQGLVAFGGRNVRETKLTEALWPDAEGDLAHSSFTTTLSRLRKLLSSDALVMHDRCLSLNDRLCWTDMWAFERLLHDTDELLDRDEPDESGVARVMSRLFDLYKGEFLADRKPAGWVLGVRNRLRLRFLRGLERLIEFHARRGACPDVLALHERTLALDPLVEEHYRGVMLCHACRGDWDRAFRAYEQCRTVYRTTFGMEPSEKTQQLWQALRTRDPLACGKLRRSCSPPN